MSKVTIELGENERIHVAESRHIKRIGIKKATFEMDADLHSWLKLHSAKMQRNMVDIVEEALRQYRQRN